MARWDRRGQHFHSLFQFLLMGLNGAFLTGDLFNLFVFFEVLLAASYGLALHGSGTLRVRAGLHYIAINLAASLLFLIGVSLIYGVTGTLNMADLAARVPLVPAENRPLLAAGAAVLGVAFLVKAAMWPLCFWLPITYMAAAPPAAAMFAILSKVGVYVVLRLSSLAFGAGAAQLTGLGAEVLLAGGLATLVFGTIGVLASQGLGRLAGCSVLVSSGTLLAVVGMAGLGGGSAMVAGGALLSRRLDDRDQRALPDGRADRARAGRARRHPDGHRRGLRPRRRASFDEDGPRGASVPASPAARRVLGLCFLACALLLAGHAAARGLPRQVRHALGGARLGRPRRPATFAASPSPSPALVIVSGLAALIALVREGIRTFWASEEEELPAVPLIELAPVVVLLALTAAMTVKAGAGHALHGGDGERAQPSARLRPGRARHRRRRRSRRDGRRMTRIVPHPLLTAGAHRDVAAAQPLLARPPRARHRGRAGRRPGDGGARAVAAAHPPLATLVVLRLFAIVIADIVRSNLAVARLILAGRPRRRTGLRRDRPARCATRRRSRSSR